MINSNQDIVIGLIPYNLALLKEINLNLKGSYSTILIEILISA
jgi:hypothetical protein